MKRQTQSSNQSQSPADTEINTATDIAIVEDNPGPSIDASVTDRHENHRLRMETELLTIESQFLRSTRFEADRLHREIAELHARLVEADQEVHRLREAEHQLKRLLAMINGSPFGFVARRKWGFRQMVERWL